VTYLISKTFRFAAAHHLPRLPEGHKCRRVHGHNYAVTLVLEAGRLDEQGMVLDYGELDEVRSWIAHTLDHRDLNDVLGDLATAEALADYVYSTWQAAYPRLCEVTVSETPDTTATITMRGAFRV